MKFTPRSDFERLCEEIKKNSDRTLDKTIIQKHLNAIAARRKKANESSEKLKRSDSAAKIKPEKNVNEFDDYIDNLQNSKKEEIEKKLKKENVPNIINRNRDLNMDSKKLMKDLHKKTHFKAAKVIANTQNDNGT